jgi:crotonobetainyl-CoA:carnitine CoA-transferase CaiB-like acyl-CoA transferase
MVPAARVADVSAALKSETIQERDLLMSVRLTDDKEIPTVSIPFTVDRLPPRGPGTAPGLSEDSPAEGSETTWSSWR